MKIMFISGEIIFISNPFWDHGAIHFYQTKALIKQKAFYSLHLHTLDSVPDQFT